MKEYHDCNNETCKLLNSSITELVNYCPRGQLASQNVT